MIDRACATIVFDAECNVCDGWVGLLQRHDAAGRLDLVPAQSPRGRALLGVAGDAPTPLDTIVLIEGGRRHVRSEAVLRAMASLGGGWRAVALLRAVPRPLRDLGYRGFARVRYRLFGKARTCRLPNATREAR